MWDLADGRCLQTNPAGLDGIPLGLHVSKDSGADLSLRAVDLEHGTFADDTLGKVCPLLWHIK